MASPWIAGPVSHIFNLSYRTSVVPVQWMRSCITPVPKIAHPVECKDFRPISVTPVLSRVMERFIVRSDLYFVLVHPDFSHLFSDQFAFRPSGSTTAALVYVSPANSSFTEIWICASNNSLGFFQGFWFCQTLYSCWKKLLNFQLKIMSITGLWTSWLIVITRPRLKAADLSSCLLLRVLFKDPAMAQWLTS